MVACQTGPYADAPTVADDAAIVADAADSIRDHAQATQTVADDGQTVAPDLPHWAQIIGHQGSIIELVLDLQAASKRLIESQAQIDALQSDLVATQKKLAKREADAAVWERRAWFGFSALGGLAVAAGVALVIFVGPSIGFACIAGGGAMLAVGATMQHFSWLIGASVAGVMLLFAAVAGLTLWYRWHKDRKAATSLAGVIRDMLDNEKPETEREVVAILRERWPALDAAMRAAL